MNKYLLLCSSLSLAFLFLLGGFAAQAQESSPVVYNQQYEKAGLPLPTIKSDKDDYAPGEVAIITGTGWLLDSYVDVHFTEDPEHEHHHGYHDTKVNEDGTWEIRFQIDDRHLGVSFTVDGVGKQTGVVAYAYFTDGRNDYTSQISPTSTCEDVSQTFNLTLNNVSQNLGPGMSSPARTFQSVTLLIPSGYTISNFSSISVSASGGNNWSIVTSPAPPAGQIRFKANTAADDIATGQSLTISFSLTPTSPGTLTWQTTVYTANDFTTGPGANNPAFQLVTMPGNVTSTNYPTTTVNTLPNCSITGADGPVCPGSSNDYTSPAGMSTYLWEVIAGVATIATGEEDDQIATVVAGAGCNTSYTLKLTITNSDGCSSSCEKVVEVKDVTAPTWTTSATALNTSVECSDAAGLTAAQAMEPVATDNCGGVTYHKTSGSFVAGACGATGTYTNTWVAKDACLNTSTEFTQVITITDVTAPTWTTSATALNTSVECSDAAGLTAAQAMEPVATDNCGGVTYHKTSGSFVAGACGATGTYTNTWVAKDACLNTSTEFTQVITITDVTAPTWTTSATALNTSVECSDAAGLTAAQAMEPVATDNCGGVTYHKTSGSFVAGACGATGTYTNTWVAKDACLNTSTEFTQVITITDVTAPTWTTSATALNTSVECSDAAGLTAAQAMEPVATDNCGGVTYHKTSGSFVAGACGATGTYTNTWVAKDACLNTSTEFTQVITITDVTAPTWTTSATALNTSVECSDAAGLTAAQAMEPVATDNCGGVTYHKTSGSFVAGACGATGTYTNTWVAKDACLNTSTEFTQVITITDVTAPTWTTSATALNTSVECSDAAGLTAAQAMEPVATDNCGGVTYHKTSGSFVAGACGATGTYTNTWVAKDACLNTSTEFTQVITITDVTAPTWTTSATALNTSVECSDAAGLTAAQAMEPVATDNCGGVTYHKTSGSFVAGACGATGTYTNTWVAKDACLNTSTEFTQVITIMDVTAPTWTTSATALNTSVECSDAAGLTAAQAMEPVATDNCGGVTYHKTSGSFVAGACGATGTYTNTWVAKDACLNTSTEFTQVITITDVTAPTWTTSATALNTSVECSDAAGLTAAQAMEPVATDNCGGVTYHKTSGSFVAGACGATGTYTNTWVAKDACLNTSTEFTQVITITDVTAPTWTTSATALNTSVECSDAAGLTAAQAMEPVATDNCGGVTYHKTSGSFVAGACGATGTYTNTWVAKDACLNTSTEFTQVITITDVTAPTWTTSATALNTSVECSDAAGLTAAQAMEPVATDNCGGVTYHKTSGSFVAGACGATGTYTNTWVAKDACLNTSTEFTQVITITDVTAPTWTTSATALNTSVECSDAAGLTAAQAMEPVATDNCGGVTYHKTSGSFVAGACGATGTYTNTWVAKDACLNTSTEFTQVITITDVTAPVVSLPEISGYLWPPNHKMRDIVLSPQIEDGCNSATNWSIISVTSNEPENSIGDGNTEKDWEFDGQSLKLRAERQGTGSGRIYTVTIEATDACGNTSSPITTEIIVAHNIHAPYNGNAVKVGTTVNFGGTFWDVAGKKHTAKWLVDGSAVATGSVVEPSGKKNGIVTGSYKFNSPGIYKLQMNITDQNGVTTYANTNGELQAMVVVYDPNGGYTMGSGSFNSPKGSIPGNPDATPKIGFGFQSNYFKNATTPKGETEFNFDAGDFQFNALNFEYLVVKDAFAQYKGSGKISNENGVIQSGISFIMTVIDGQVTGGGGVDKIRMKIFNKNSGLIYYDNMPGASDEMVPVTQIDPDGNIVVTSTPTNGKTEIVTTVVQESTVDPKSFNVKAYPNPSEQYFNLNVQSGSQEHVDMKVFDIQGRVVYTTRGSANQSYRFGDKFVAGIYLVEVRQGDKRSVIQIVKQ